MTDNLLRERAADAIEEVIACTDACLATGEPTGSLRATVVAVRETLLTIADAVRKGRELVVEVPAPHPGTEAGPGYSMAAAMARLARATSRRAGHELRAVPGIHASVLDYVTGLPNLLGVIAEDLDAEEAQSVPSGMCLP
ncbi:hypothetical protein FPZ12_011230 [Amycolatopsis acidicola]|uniref:Uncharacterized protein n=1 Tax=Amycolatopsis acidicola TaxID=2596893 RepID=A0A5N0VBV9_9PSEU|nr:hypothetical protein [Amycolatopsis acidicola]KAA9162620.1 hypothetical protein FPZ12_011230 [Amycolatopsis acidicola]